MEQSDHWCICFRGDHGISDGEEGGKKKGVFLVALVPGSFYLFIISSFILSQKIGFGLSMNVSYAIAGALTVLYFFGLIAAGKKYAAKHEEE